MSLGFPGIGGGESQAAARRRRAIGFGKPLDPGVDLDRFEVGTAGRSGAILHGAAR